MKQMIAYAIPLMLANLLMTLYNLVDLAIVGQIVGKEGLSAVSTSGNITFILYALGMSFANGTQVLVAQQSGVKDEEGIRKTATTTILATVILALAMMVIGLLTKNMFLRILNTPEEAWTDAAEYMSWCCYGIPFTYGAGSLAAILRGRGDSRHPMYFVAVAAISNIFLDYLFVAAFGLRAKGAAMATSIAQMLSFVFTLWFCIRHKQEFGFDIPVKEWRIDGKIMGTVCRLAAPIAVSQILINISMMYVHAMVNAYGVIASSVSGIGGKLNSLMGVVTGAMQTAVATFVGQNIAAGRVDRAKSSVYRGAVLAMMFWVVLAVICLFWPRGLFGLFTSDEEVLALARAYSRPQIVMYLSFALMCESNGLLTGLGHTHLNMAISLADGVAARIGLSMFFAQMLGMGMQGYWWGSACAGLVSVVLGWSYFWFGKWEKKKTLIAKMNAG